MVRVALCALILLAAPAPALAQGAVAPPGWWILKSSTVNDAPHRAGTAFQFLHDAIEVIRFTHGRPVVEHRTVELVPVEPNRWRVDAHDATLQTLERVPVGLRFRDATATLTLERAPPAEAERLAALLAARQRRK